MELEVLKAWTEWVMGWVLLLFIVSWLISLLPFGRDDTDGPWPNRSGIKVVTDAKTGCQYLAHERGGLTPRLDAEGRHICV